MSYHVPVLAKASLDLLGVDPDGTYVDATFGGGGDTPDYCSSASDRKVAW